MKRLFATAAFCLLTAGLSSAQEFVLGGKVPVLTANNLQGDAVEFNPQTSDVTVVLFTSTVCPVSNAYNERMDALYKQYAGKKVQFLFLNANGNESAGDVTAHLKSHGLSYPVHKDNRNLLADRFGARVTPEAYVIDRTGTLLYHGAIDDSQNTARIRNRPLQSAIDAVLAGKPVPTAESKAFGCTIKRANKTT